MQGSPGTTSETEAVSIGGPTSAAWREEMLTRAEELSGLKSWILAHRDHCEPEGDLPDGIRRHLETAKKTAAGRDEHRLTRRWHTFTGSSFERTLGNLDAAEVDLLRLAPAAVLKGGLPSIRAHVNRFLPKNDPRRIALDKIDSTGAVEQSSATCSSAPSTRPTPSDAATSSGCAASATCWSAASWCSP